MQKPVEVIQGDKSLRLTIYLILAFYILLLLLVEPVLNFFLQLDISPLQALSQETINKRKLHIATMIYTALAILPFIFFTWYGYRIMASAKIPPVLNSGISRFPFTVVVIKGRFAKMFAILIITVSLMLIFQIFLYLAKNLLL